MRFNEHVMLAELKRKNSAKITSHCGSRYHNYSTNFMMIVIYCSLEIEIPQLVELFVKLVDLEPIQIVPLVSKHHEFDFDLIVG